MLNDIARKLKYIIFHVTLRSVFSAVEFTP